MAEKARRLIHQAAKRRKESLVTTKEDIDFDIKLQLFERKMAYYSKSITILIKMVNIRNYLALWKNCSSMNSPKMMFSPLILQIS